MLCKNCENLFDGNFCNNCGQSRHVRKIDSKYILSEIQNTIFQMEKGFFYTVKELLIRPGHSLRDLLEGKRQPHLKPFAFLLFASTLYALSKYFTESDNIVDEFIIGLNSDIEGNENDRSPVEFLDWLANNQVYTALILVPFYSMASYLAFIKSKYNYFELLTLNFYITGQQMLIYTLFGLIISVESDLILIPLVLGFLFNCWVFHQFFIKYRFITKVLLMFLTYLLFFLQLIVIIVVVVLPA